MVILMKIAFLTRVTFVLEASCGAEISIRVSTYWDVIAAWISALLYDSFKSIGTRTISQKVRHFSWIVLPRSTFLRFKHLSSFLLGNIHPLEVDWHQIFQLEWMNFWRDIDIRKSCKKCHIFRRVLSEKVEYLGKGTIFFKTACAEIH